MNILLTPARIGPVEIPNRIVMPPMTTRGSDEEGHVTDQTVAYYMARVRGGVGLITVEMASPEKAGRHRRRELGIYHDEFIPGLTRLVGEIHRGGAKASIQLGHGGGHTRIDICGEQPVAPSAIPHPVYETTLETIIPEAMSKERIAETTANYAAAAKRAQEAGFDCVEIHAAHGYLISQFHAPFENRRTDEYGGSLENRARFGLDVLRAVKAAVPSLGVIYRLSVEDYFDGGLTYDEGRTIAIWAAQAGADALHVTAGHYRSKPTAHRMIPPMTEPDATFLDFAADVKKAIKVPVIAVGRLGDPAIATAAVASGKCDFIALGRTLVADPQWVDEAPPRRADPPLPRLQHLHRRHAQRRRHLLRGQRRGRPRGDVRASVAAARRAHRRDRRGPRGPHLRFAGRRGQRRHGVREGRARRRRVPLRRPGADVPGGRRQPGELRALRPRHGRGLQSKRRDLPLRHRRDRASRACSRRSTASWWRPARPIRSAPARWRWACSNAALDIGRSCRG